MTKLFSSIVLLCVLLFQEKLILADEIYLSSGGIIECEIVSQDEKTLTLKGKNGLTTTIDKNLVKSIVKPKDTAVTSYLDEYLLKKKNIKDDDAEAYFELGVFCKAHGMYNYAYEEFNAAIKIDKSFEDKASKQLNDISSDYGRTLLAVAKYYIKRNYKEKAKIYLERIISEKLGTNSISEANDLLGTLIEKKTQIAPPKKTQNLKLDDAIKRGEIYIPVDYNEVSRIVEIAKSLDPQVRYGLAKKYVAKAQEILIKKASSTKDLIAQAGPLYNIAYTLNNGEDKELYQMINGSKYTYFEPLVREFGEKEQSKVIVQVEVPDSDKKIKEIKSFIYCLEDPGYGLMYISLGDEYAKKKTAKDNSIALNCYNIALEFSRDASLRQAVISKINEIKK